MCLGQTLSTGSPIVASRDGPHRAMLVNSHILEGRGVLRHERRVPNVDLPVRGGDEGPLGGLKTTSASP